MIKDELSVCRIANDGSAGVSVLDFQRNDQMKEKCHLSTVNHIMRFGAKQSRSPPCLCSIENCNGTNGFWSKIPP